MVSARWQAFKRIPTRLSGRLRLSGTLGRPAPPGVTPRRPPASPGARLRPRGHWSARRPPLASAAAPFPAPCRRPGRCASPACAPVADIRGAASFSRATETGKQTGRLVDSRRGRGSGALGRGGGAAEPESENPGPWGRGQTLTASRSGLFCGRGTRPACPRLLVGFRVTPPGFALLVGSGGG